VNDAMNAMGRGDLRRADSMLTEALRGRSMKSENSIFFFQVTTRHAEVLARRNDLDGVETRLADAAEAFSAWRAYVAGRRRMPPLRRTPTCATIEFEHLEWLRRCRRRANEVRVPRGTSSCIGAADTLASLRQRAASPPTSKTNPGSHPKKVFARATAASLGRSDMRCMAPRNTTQTPRHAMVEKSRMKIR